MLDVVFRHLAKPIAGYDLLTGFCQRSEWPNRFFVERESPGAGFEEHSLHFVKIVLQTIIIPG